MSRPYHSRRVTLVTFSLLAMLTPSRECGAAPFDFVNFESGHTRPLAIAPSADLLLAVNTPANSLSILRIDGTQLSLAAQIPVGLEPVAVAARTNTTTGKDEAWVVNLLSDSVSILEIDRDEPSLSHVVRTLQVGDEPRDVVFAGTGSTRAFITTARRGQNLPENVRPRLLEKSVARALVWVFDADAPGDASTGSELGIVELFGDSPRALAVSADGASVYAAVFHSGNRTTIALDSDPIPAPPDSPYLDDPTRPPSQPIVRYMEGTGSWLDGVGRDWSHNLRFHLPDYDIFRVDADATTWSPAAIIETFTGIGTTIFDLVVRPGSDTLFVANTEARNDVPFEPLSAGGVQGHVVETRITVADSLSVTPVHVNPHIDYTVPTGPPAEIAQSTSMLTSVAFSADGTRLYATAFGSNEVVSFDADALAAGTVEKQSIAVGAGPSGIVVAPSNRLYVMNRLDHTVSILEDDAVVQTVSLGVDPTPAPLRAGRRFLYDARETSGHGDASCASCHVFGDTDHLSWDLGDPYGELLDNPNPFVTFRNFSPQRPTTFHPLKGPMFTQSLRGLAAMGPMHWRGDRTAGNDPGGSSSDTRGAFAKFNAAFVSLLGREQPLVPEDMEMFTDFALSMRYPPNPVRALDGILDADQAAGLEVFQTEPSSPSDATCGGCHALPFGTSTLLSAESGDLFKVPHLRNVYQKIGMFSADRIGDPSEPIFQGDQVRGFGLLHDGEIGSLLDFAEGFNQTSEQARLVAEFVLTIDTGLHPAVGQQVTLDAVTVSDSATIARLQLLLDRDAAGDCDLTVQARVGGQARSGQVVSGARIWLDGSSEPLVAISEFTASAAQPQSQQTFTCNPPGTGTLMAMDFDLDGIANADEVAEGSDPLDAASASPACSDGATLSQAGVKIGRNDAPAGDETITIQGQWLLPEGSDGIDLVADGMNVVLRDASGQIVLHRRIAPGQPDSFGNGWKVGGSRWSYRSLKGALGGGIIKAGLSVSAAGLVKFKIKGVASDYLVRTQDLTLEVTAGGAAAADSGLCATLTFPGPGEDGSCSSKGRTLRCG